MITSLLILKVTIYLKGGKAVEKKLSNAAS